MFYSEREVLRPILTDGSMGVVPGLNRMVEEQSGVYCIYCLQVSMCGAKQQVLWRKYESSIWMQT